MSSGKGLLAPGAQCVILILQARAVVSFVVAPFETHSMQVVRCTHRHVLPIAFHNRGWLHLLNDVAELITGDTSFKLLETGGHVQVAHLGCLFLGVRVIWIDFCLGIQDLGKRDRAVMLW